MIGAGVGAIIGGVSGFVGVIVTGGSLESAAVSGVIGAGTGAFIGSGLGLVGSGLLGSASNLAGQIISNNIDDNANNNTNINWGSVIGSGIGGVWSAGVTKSLTGVAGQFAAGEISFQIGAATTAVGAALWCK